MFGRKEKCAVRFMRIPLRFLHTTAPRSLYLPPADDRARQNPARRSRGVLDSLT